MFVILLTIDAKRRLETREVNLKNMRQFIIIFFYLSLVKYSNVYSVDTPACYEKHLTLIGLDATNSLSLFSP